jgi:hypothetical protein
MQEDSQGEDWREQDSEEGAVEVEQPWEVLDEEQEG